MLAGLAAIDEMVGATRYFEALKRIRALFPVEEAILVGAAAASPEAA
jgi:flagellar protein FlbT